MEHKRSAQAFAHAKQVLPGGVDSPVRAFQKVGIDPIFVDHAKGCEIVDVDGNAYIDYIGSWGPMILGHLHPAVMAQFLETAMQGISYGLPSQKESELADLMIDAYPGLEMVRFVTSGTEATMSAIRAARGFTKRDKIIKFAGCYHGHHDGMLVAAGSGAVTFAQPDSLGVPASMIQDTIVCPYNDIEAVKQALIDHPEQIAAIIIEPVAANMGVIPPNVGYLKQLRELCTDHHVILIFDEVITGFRLAYGGASEYYGVTPDLACFGKIIGAGMSVGAYGGRKEIMALISPSGGVYQAGTLAGNPLTMSLGIRQLTYLRDHPSVYDDLNAYALQLKTGIEQILMELKLPYQVQQVASLMTVFFGNHAIQNFDDVQQCDQAAFAIWYRMLLDQGILIAPSPYEAIFISAAHQQAQLEKTLTAMGSAFAALLP